MIDTKELKEKIKRMEEIHICSLYFESAKKLIEKVQVEYKQGMKREEYMNLVERCAKELELPYNYCRVVFSYLRKKRRKNVQKKNSTEHRQTTFPPHLAIR